jgi:hypothetical protein|tara:strand:- start:42 stop:1718 length:1677 start_codon:yes stop_codon:yes gene_type:complete
MSLERQIRKIMANSVGISEKVIKTPQKLQRKMQLKNKTNFDFRLFDPEDSPGSDKANDDMNKEIVKASKMKDKNTAYQHMMKIQKKHSKHGATDTEPREMIRAILDRVFDESVNFEENFMNPDCDICSDGSPCICKIQGVEEALDADDTPQIKKIVKKLKGASKAHADQAKSLEKELSDDKKVMCPKCKGEGCEHCDNKGYHMSEDIRNLPKDKQRALQHADKTAKPKSKVSLAPTPGIKTEETNLDEAFEQFFTEGYEGEVKKVLDKKGIDAYFKNGKLMVSKRDKGMVIQILKRQDFDMPKIQVEEIQMESNRFGLSVSLVDAVADVLAGKRPVEEKKKMDPVGQEDGDIDNDGDKDDSDEYLMKKRKAIGKAMKKDAGGKEPVDTKPKMDEEKIDEKLTPAQRDMRDAGRGKDAGAKSYVKHQAGSDNPHKKGRMHKGDTQSHDDQRHVRKGEDDFKKPSQDKLASQPSPAKRLDMKKKKDAFDKAKAQSQSPSGRDNMGGVGVREGEMTDAQMKRREEIVKELKKKSADFESRYGDKADAVMYATATKMAMKGK